MQFCPNEILPHQTMLTLSTKTSMTLGLQIINKKLFMLANLLR